MKLNLKLISRIMNFEILLFWLATIFLIPFSNKLGEEWKALLIFLSAFAIQVTLRELLRD